MSYLGFTRNEIRTITLIASLFSIIGPLIIGFILDRVALNRAASYGKYLRVLLVISFLCAGLLFGSLLFVSPADNKSDNAEPSVTFSCDARGGHIFQKRCGDNEPCFDLVGQTGTLSLSNCSYTCEKPENFKYLYDPYMDKYTQERTESTVDQSTESTEANLPSAEEDYDEGIKSYSEVDALPEPAQLVQVNPVHIRPPHICINNGTSVNCHVPLEGKAIDLKHVEGIAADPDDNNTFSDEWCKHNIGKLNC